MIWLTPAAHDKLRRELEVLNNCVAGAPSDDGNAVAVRRAQQGRIQQIHEMLVEAVIGEDPPNDGVAEPGMVLRVRFEDTGYVETFLLGTREADYGDIEVYSLSSPLGRAISGARAGTQRSYQLPGGRIQVVTLMEAVPYGLHQTLHA